MTKLSASLCMARAATNSGLLPASKSQSFFVISSAAARRTIIDPAKHARSIQKKQQQISGRVGVARGSRGAQPASLRSPETVIPALGAKTCVRNVGQARPHGWGQL